MTEFRRDLIALQRRISELECELKGAKKEHVEALKERNKIVDDLLSKLQHEAEIRSRLKIRLLDIADSLVKLSGALNRRGNDDD